MKHLMLLRHAKSSWDHPELSDEERPLAPRVCEWLCFGRESGSTSLRTANLAWLELPIENWEETTAGCGVLRSLIPSRLIKALL